jgi:hypothetical protein
MKITKDLLLLLGFKEVKGRDGVLYCLDCDPIWVSFDANKEPPSTCVLLADLIDSTELIKNILDRLREEWTEGLMND